MEVEILASKLCADIILAERDVDNLLIGDISLLLKKLFHREEYEVIVNFKHILGANVDNLYKIIDHHNRYQIPLLGLKKLVKYKKAESFYEDVKAL